MHVRARSIRPQFFEYTAEYAQYLHFDCDTDLGMLISSRV